MESSNLETMRSVEQCILRFIEAFQLSPFSFLYESDIQALLFSEIRASLPDTIAVPGTGHPLNSYNISIAHTEYWKRIDIACLDVELAKTHKIRLHKGMDIHLYEMPLLIGIEIKYRKIGDVFGVESCISDFLKLTELSVAHPIVLGFLQSDKDFDKFLCVNRSEFIAIEVEINSPIESINIVSPTRRWTVVKNS